MSDDKSKVGAPDREKINQHEPYELAFAAKEMGVSDAEIREAIAKVGVSREKVAAYLKKEKEVKMGG